MAFDALIDMVVCVRFSYFSWTYCLVKFRVKCLGYEFEKNRVITGVVECHCVTKYQSVYSSRKTTVKWSLLRYMSE